MKAISKSMLPLLMSAGLLFATPYVALAQDATEVAPASYQKVLLENEQVRVIKVTLKPGVTIPWHSHPNHVVYAETAGKIRLMEKDKAPMDKDITAGSAIYSPAVTHMAKNIGKTTVKLIMVEMKQ